MIRPHRQTRRLPFWEAILEVPDPGSAITQQSNGLDGERTVGTTAVGDDLAAVGKLSQDFAVKKGSSMIEARCNCGALAVEVPGPSELIAACHCTECQRRTGSPFGVGAFYPLSDVRITGTAKEFARDGSSGGKVRTYFCLNCGSAVYWKADEAPGFIAVAVGSFADSSYPHPTRPIWEQSKQPWAQVGADQHSD